MRHRIGAFFGTHWGDVGLGFCVREVRCGNPVCEETHGWMVCVQVLFWDFGIIVFAGPPDGMNHG